MITISANSIVQPSGIFVNLVTTNMLQDLHLHDGFYELMVILRGSLFHHTEDNTRQLSAGELVFLPSGTTHTLYNASEDLMFLNVAVLPVIMSRAVSYMNLQKIPERVLFSRAPDFVLAFLVQNYNYSRETPASALLTTCDCSALTLLLPHCCSTERVSDWFDALSSQMKRRDNFQMGVARMQQLAFCSPSHLSRTCRNRLGMTPTQFIEKTRIEYAVQLLCYTDDSIRDISMDCGFDNLTYFYRCFKRYTGMTPGQCRSNVRNVAARTPE